MYEPHLNSVSITNVVKEKKPDVLVVNQTKINRATIDVDPMLKLIVKCGSDVSLIDVEYCSSKGIFVANCKG